MNALIKVFSILAVIPLLIGGCAGQPAQTRQEEQTGRKVAVYESILGKSLTDEAVADFLASNACSSADKFLLCKEIGMALWINSNQVVETVYLYLNTDEDIKPFNGELPFGLKFYDIQEAVEYKLKRQGVGNQGLPDEGSSPDRLHYWALYKEAGMTIIFNAPYPDGDTTIYAILVSK